jgi:hypothetical protein
LTTLIQDGKVKTEKGLEWSFPKIEVLAFVEEEEKIGE